MPESTDRIRHAFERAASEDRAALVIYTTAGYPDKDAGLETLMALTDAGADLLELGVPFSDPLADGPTIQKSSFNVIEQGVDLPWTLELCRRFRARSEIPVVLFTYLNPLMDYGIDRFLTDAVEAGADGVLLTDLPLGADPEIERRFEQSPLDLVRLIAPTTRPERAREIASHSQGFAYYISRTGVTGVQQDLSASLEAEAAELRQSTDVPLVVGFGISRPEHAARVAAVAEGVAVGSAVVDALGRSVEEAASLVASLRGALRRSDSGAAV